MMLLRSPWFGRRRRLMLPPEPQTAAEIRARRAARALARQQNLVRVDRPTSEDR